MAASSLAYKARGGFSAFNTQSINNLYRHRFADRLSRPASQEVTRNAEILAQNAERCHDDRSQAFDTGGTMLMADITISREELLKTIKLVENQSMQREEKAQVQASSVRASTLSECAKIIEKAEMEGRIAMRQAIEAVKLECKTTKDMVVKQTVLKGQAQEQKSKARISGVADMMFNKFKKEYDVKD